MNNANRRRLLKVGATAAAGISLHGVVCSIQAKEARGAREADPQLLEEIASGGALSGLPWNSGAFSKVDQLAAFRGRPVDLYGSFINHGSWNDMLNFPYNTNFLSFLKKPIWISLGYPLIPKNSGGISPSKWDQLANPGNPVYEDFYSKHRQIAENLGSTMYSSGRRCRGVIARVGWEFNGSQPWKLTDYKKASEYKEVFRTLAFILRDIVPDILIEWNPLRNGTQRDLSIEEIYPGDDAVDIISICHYDRLPSFNTEEIWGNQLWRYDRWGNPWGIGAWIDWAWQHGKKFAVPEWGLANGMRYASTSIDNPLYIQFMFDFFNDFATDMAYESYFNNGDYHQIVPSLRNPRGAMRYRELYSG